VLTVIGITAAAWTAVLALPPPAPRWLLVLLVVVLALGGPGSIIGFDYARTFNPGCRQGTAVGIVNVGGFSASVVVVLAIGVLLGLVAGRPGTRRRRSGGLECAVRVWAIALVGVLRARGTPAARWHETASWCHRCGWRWGGGGRSAPRCGDVITH